MLKIAICDDEEIVVEEIGSILDTFSIENNFIIEKKKYFSGEEILISLKLGEKFDVIFLDIDMGKINGVQTAKIIRNKLNISSTKIIFVTAKESYMKEAFMCDALRFISKPIDKKIVFDALKYIINSSIIEKKVFTYKEKTCQGIIPYDEIIYIEASHRKVTVKSKYKEVVCNVQLNTIEEEFLNQGFIRISRKTLVNKEYCSRLNGEYIELTNGKEVKISRIMKEEFKQWFDKRCS